MQEEKALCKKTEECSPWRCLRLGCLSICKNLSGFARPIPLSHS